MDETEQLSSLVGGIYDAALDPSRWMGVLKASTEFIGGFAAGVYINRQCFDFGIDPRYVESYHDTYYTCDPRLKQYGVVPLGSIFTASGGEPRAEFQDSRFYQEYMQPQDVSENLLCVLERSPTQNSGFGLFRHPDSGCPQASMRRMGLLMPHFRRALRIGNAVDMSRAEAASFASVLDGLTAAVFVLDAKRRVVHANASGRAMLAEGTLLRVSGGQLTAKGAAARRVIEAGVAQAAKAGGNGAGDAVTAPLTTDAGDSFVAHMLPLTSGARQRSAALYGAVAALIVHKATFDTPSSLAAVVDHYALTPAELRVLLAVAEVGGVREVAETLGIAQTTVKTHLQRIFAKTDTRRQADLVRLLAQFSNPLLR